MALKTSDRAIEEAIKIAEVYNSDIHILYVANINQLAINACLSDAILEAVTKAGNEILEKAANKVPEKINVITNNQKLVLHLLLSQILLMEIKLT